MLGSWVRSPAGSLRILKFVFHFIDDLVAQLVEHNTFNVGVLGSSPSQVTFFNVSSLRGEIGRLAILRGWCSLGRAGSNPVVGTLLLHNMAYL